MPRQANVILPYGARNQRFRNAVALREHIDKRMYDGSRKGAEANYWMCNECNYVFKAEAPPETCSGCQAKCIFMNVNCYIPECGGPSHYDPKLVAQCARESKRKKR